MLELSSILHLGFSLVTRAPWIFTSTHYIDLGTQKSDGVTSEDLRVRFNLGNELTEGIKD